MRPIEIDIIEKLLIVSEKIKKYWDNKIFDQSGITVLQFNILWEIVSKWWLTIKELKSNLIVSAASLSQTLNRMEKAWFLQRTLGTWDRREIMLTASDKWNQLYSKLSKIYVEEALKKFKNLNDDEKKKILDSIILIDSLI